MTELIGHVGLPSQLDYGSESCVKIRSISRNCYCLYYNNVAYLIQFENRAFVVKATYMFPSYVTYIALAESEMYAVTSEGIMTESVNRTSELMEDTVEDIFAELNNFEKESHKLLTDFTYKQDSIESLVLVSEKIVICFKDKLLNAWTVKILYKEQFGHEKICFTVEWDNYPSNENIEDHLLLDPFEKKSFPLHHRPILLSIVRSDDISTSETTCNLQKHLFISLFGSSTFLASQDVILLGLPDGRVLWKNICSVSNEAKAHLLCKLNQPIIGLFCTKLHLQKGETISQAQDSLIVLGSEGKFIVFTMSEKSDHENKHLLLFSYLETSLYSYLVWKRYIIYVTTSGELFRAELQLNEDSLNINTYTLPVNRVITFSFIEEENSIKLLCVTYTGDLYIVPFNDGTEEYSNPNEVQNILKSINNCSNEILQQQLILKEQQQALSQLAIAANLLFCKQVLDDIKYTLETIKESEYVLQVDFSPVKKLDIILGYWYFAIFIHINDKSICKFIPIDKCFHSQFKLNIERASAFSHPIKVECILQLDVSSVKNLPLSIKKLSPVYISVKEEYLDLWDFLLDEKNEDLFNYHSVENKHDKGKQLCEGLEFKSFFSENNMNFDKVRPLTTVILISTYRIGRKCIKNNDGEINMDEILKYFSEKNVNQNLKTNNNCLQCYCFGLKIFIRFFQKQEFLQACVDTHHMWHMCKLRRIIIQKLKGLLNMQKPISEKTITLSKTCFVETKALYDKLCSNPNGPNIQEMLQIYEEIRMNISKHLPII
ncbi:uncharacterized protein [Centruroides vittatus]|uniref:uncharacterized protein n=1 Tax=Centruroides vittatus TaxID=120091 RepID=UPI0035102D6A